MMRVVVFGNSGSGKSTYAQAQAARHGVPHLDLDSIVWEPGQIAVERPAEAIRQSLDDFLSRHETWVVEGCYGELVEAAAGRCTVLVFLNPGLEACLANNTRRPWEPHRYASFEQQNSMLAVLQRWVADYYVRSDSWSYEAHRRIFDAHAGRKIEHTRLAPTGEPMTIDDIKNFVPLSERLATAGQPTEQQVQELARAGFEVVVNLGLMDPRYCLTDEAGLVGSLGMAYHHIPVDFKAPRFDDLEKFFAVMDGSSDRKVFVHCAANYRVSSFVALYGQAKLGWSASHADAHIRRVWEPDHTWRGFIEECRRIFASQA